MKILEVIVDEVPIKCESCLLSRRDINGEWECGITCMAIDKTAAWAMRHKDCPLHIARVCRNCIYQSHIEEFIPGFGSKGSLSYRPPDYALVPFCNHKKGLDEITYMDFCRHWRGK